MHNLHDLGVYRPRHVEARGYVFVSDWQFKLYSISPDPEFQSEETFEAAITELHEWSKRSEELRSAVHKLGFLIVHEGRDGIWSIAGWWTGGEMLQVVTFYTDRASPNIFENFPSYGAMLCTWELTVVCHERTAWVEHILKRSEEPDVAGYLNDSISDTF